MACASWRPNPQGTPASPDESQRERRAASPRPESCRRSRWASRALMRNHDLHMALRQGQQSSRPGAPARCRARNDRAAARLAGDDRHLPDQLAAPHLGQQLLGAILASTLARRRPLMITYRASPGLLPVEGLAAGQAQHSRRDSTSARPRRGRRLRGHRSDPVARGKAAHMRPHFLPAPPSAASVAGPSLLFRISRRTRARRSSDGNQGFHCGQKRSRCSRSRISAAVRFGLESASKRRLKFASPSSK